jgi:hypothetical protein
MSRAGHGLQLKLNAAVALSLYIFGPMLEPSLTLASSVTAKAPNQWCHACSSIVHDNGIYIHGASNDRRPSHRQACHYHV